MRTSGCWYRLDQVLGVTPDTAQLLRTYWADAVVFLPALGKEVVIGIRNASLVTGLPRDLIKKALDAQKLTAVKLRRKWFIELEHLLAWAKRHNPKWHTSVPCCARGRGQDGPR